MPTKQNPIRALLYDLGEYFSPLEKVLRNCWFLLGLGVLPLLFTENRPFIPRVNAGAFWPVLCKPLC
jgi:hypothetical protein